MIQKRSIVFSLFALLIFFSFSCSNDNKKVRNAEGSQADPALEELNLLINGESDNPELFIQRARLLYEKEAFDEAMDDVAKAQKIDSINPDYYHLLADIYLDYYKSFEALKIMEKVVAMHPQRKQSLLKLAEFQYILKKYDQSIITLNNVLAVDRLEPEAFFMLGMNFRAMGDMERAKNSFQTAVENEPELTDAWMMLGNIYENEGDEKALIFYDNALLVAPDNLEAIHAKAFFLQNNGKIPQALDLYKKIIILDPQYSDAYLNSGLLFLEMDSLAKAREQFEIMVKMDLTNPVAYFYRAYIYERVGELKKARMDYEQALKLSPDFEEAKNALELLISKEAL